MLKKGQFKNAVKMNNIEKYFGHVAALKGINFEVGNNEVVGLIGDNGAGKSTLIKIITGVFPPTNGEIYIRDKKGNVRCRTSDKEKLNHNLGQLIYFYVVICH